MTCEMTWKWDIMTFVIKRDAITTQFHSNERAVVKMKVMKVHSGEMKSNKASQPVSHTSDHDSVFPSCSYNWRKQIEGKI